MKLLRLSTVLTAALGAGATAFALTNADLVKMANAGLSAEIMVTVIKSSPSNTFDTSADGLIALKAAKVPDSVFVTILTPAGGSAALLAIPVSSAPATTPVTSTTTTAVPTTNVPVDAHGAGYTVKKGIYFVKEGGKPVRATQITPSEIKKPFATFNPNYKIKALFAGAAASQTVKTGDVIVVAGWDVQPQVARFQSENGRRLATLNSSGKLLPGEVVSIPWERDVNDNWIAVVPSLPAGEYWVLVDAGDPTPATDFSIR
jgi:hypothetical protein